jgi:hypothetical protein
MCAARFPTARQKKKKKKGKTKTKNCCLLPFVYDTAAAANKAATQALFSDALALDDDNDEDDEVVGPLDLFSVSVGMDDVLDPQLKPGVAFQSPNICVSFKEAAAFDPESRPMLISRIPVAGVNVTVEEPVLSSTQAGGQNTVLTIRLKRTNLQDLTETVFPDATPAQRQGAIKQLELEKNFGQHVTYDVLNRLYQALAPPEEGWTITITLGGPYFFKGLDSVFVLRSKNARDVFLMAAIDSSVAPPERKRPRIIEVGGIDASPPGGWEAN